MNDFAKNLRALRKGKGNTQKQMADMLFISYGAYSAYEIGISQCNYDNLIKLANYFGVTVGQLIGSERLEVEHGN